MTQNQNARINELLNLFAHEFGTDINTISTSILSTHVKEVLTGTSERKPTTLYFVGTDEAHAKNTNEFDSYESAEDYMLSQDEPDARELNIYIASADIDFKTLQKYSPYGA